MEETLPGAPTADDGGERVVLHVDMDCFSMPVVTV